MEKLTNQEEDIMLRIWRLGRCAVKQIMELLPEPRPPYTTVASIVNNLKRKDHHLTPGLASCVGVGSNCAWQLSDDINAIAKDNPMNL
jgi:hypothetical protein